MRILCLVWVLFWASPSYAQDALFVLPEEDQMTRLLEPDKPPIEAPKTAKTALDLYLKNCMTQKHPVLTEEHVIPLCLCTAAKMEERFSPEEIPAMFGETKRSQTLRDSALSRAFAPCMQDTVYEVTLAECMGNKTLTLKKREATCACTAQAMRFTMSKKAEWLAEQYISYHKTKAPDPLALYVQSHAISEDTKTGLRTCMQWHEYGWETKRR